MPPDLAAIAHGSARARCFAMASEPRCRCRRMPVLVPGIGRGRSVSDVHARRRNRATRLSSVDDPGAPRMSFVPALVCASAAEALEDRICAWRPVFLVVWVQRFSRVAGNWPDQLGFPLGVETAALASPQVCAPEIRRELRASGVKPGNGSALSGWM